MMRQVTEMLQGAIICRSKSSYCSPASLVKKKNGQWCFCVDYRRLNAITAADAFPMPQIEEDLDVLQHSVQLYLPVSRCRIQCTELCEEAIPKTVFCTADGLKGAPAVFQHLMQQVLEGLSLRIAIPFLDDVIVQLE